MLFVVFQVGVERYVLSGAHVVEVLPAIHWTPISGTPAGVAGVFNYHGTPVPLINASALLTGDSAATSNEAFRLHTRIVIVCPDAQDRPGASLLGVLVSRVLGTIRRENDAFSDPGPVARGAPYLGPVLTDADGIVQRIEPEHLLPASVRDEVLRQWSAAV